MDKRPSEPAVVDRNIRSLQRSLQMLQPFPHLNALARENGGNLGEIRYSAFAGASRYSMTCLQMQLLWMQQHIQSFAVAFGGAAGALAFLKVAKPFLKAWLGRASARQVTIRGGGISVGIKGTSDIESALKAFREISDALRKEPPEKGETKTAKNKSVAPSSSKNVRARKPQRKPKKGRR